MLAGVLVTSSFGGIVNPPLPEEPQGLSSPMMSVRGNNYGVWKTAIGTDLSSATPNYSTFMDPDYSIWNPGLMYSFNFTVDGNTGGASLVLVADGRAVGTQMDLGSEYAGLTYDGVDIGAVGYVTSILSLENMEVNGQAIPNIGGGYAYNTHSFNFERASVVSVTGEFRFSGDFEGLGDQTRFDIGLTGAEVIPEPASIGLLALVSGGIYFSRRFFLV